MYSFYLGSACCFRGKLINFITTDARCAICGNGEEMNLHALRDCSWVASTWRNLLRPSQHATFFSLTTKHWIDWNLQPRPNRYGDDACWDIIFTEVLNLVWQGRNRFTYGTDMTTPSVDDQIIHTRVNGFQGTIGQASVLEAELQLLPKGLDMAWEMRIPIIMIESDSLEAVKCIDEAAFAHMHFRTITHIRQRLALPWQAKIRHVRREANRVADILAKTGIHTTMKMLTDSIGEVHEAMEQDRVGMKWPRLITINPGLSG